MVSRLALSSTTVMLFLSLTLSVDSSADGASIVLPELDGDDE